MTSITNRVQSFLILAVLWVFSQNASAQMFDMRRGVTDMSQRVQSLHHLILGICVVVGAIVFGVMFYSIIAHRRSKHPEPAKFHESTAVEVVWTLIPTLILIGAAVPATMTLIDIEDNSDADLTVLITASQWKWHYQYVEAGIGFYSNLTTPLEQINNVDPKGEYYLLEVDNPLVLPTNLKVRFLTTSDDVIHSWWVPDFAVKQDALPGFINEAWTRVNTPGVYRGQCTELCGMNHAFMPVVVEVRSEEDFLSWIDDQRLANELAGEAAVAARSRDWTMAELMPMGEDVFLTHCATCHQPDGVGQGIKYPALAGGVIPTGPVEAHLERVMDGLAETEMQAWAPQLSDLDLAAVITYERNAWGNDTGDVVQPLTVYSAR
ncbi:MAG: cytochrome c oxidase subunit II [Gammaproteobacteria bacterium]|nr:cytochrome c oxidase subunit II [Gammaproteobacteria bacterium]